MCGGGYDIFGEIDDGGECVQATYQSVKKPYKFKFHLLNKIKLRRKLRNSLRFAKTYIHIVKVVLKWQSIIKVSIITYSHPST